MIRLCNPCDCIVAKLKASFEEALSSQRPGVVKGWFAWCGASCQKQN